MDETVQVLADPWELVPEGVPPLDVDPHSRRRRGLVLALLVLALVGVLTLGLLGLSTLDAGAAGGCGGG
jgi:hypothetical protein